MYAAARCLRLLICEMKFDLRKCRYSIDCGTANVAVRTTHKYVE
jgi:hypothetical protein